MTDTNNNNNNAGNATSRQDVTTDSVIPPPPPNHNNNAATAAAAPTTAAAVAPPSRRVVRLRIPSGARLVQIQSPHHEHSFGTTTTTSTSSSSGSPAASFLSRLHGNVVERDHQHNSFSPQPSPPNAPTMTTASHDIATTTSVPFNENNNNNPHNNTAPSTTNEPAATATAAATTTTAAAATTPPQPRAESRVFRQRLRHVASPTSPAAAMFSHLLSHPPMARQIDGAPTNSATGADAAATTTTTQSLPPPLQVHALPDTLQELRPEPESAAASDNTATTVRPPHCDICFEYLSHDIRACQYEDCTARFCGTCLSKYTTVQEQQQAAASRNRNPTQNPIAPMPCPLCRRPAVFSPDEAMTQRLVDTIPPIPCRYAACDAILPLGELEAHQRECPFQRVYCRFHAVGCPWQGFRRDVTHHQNDDCQLAPLAPYIHQQRQVQAQLQQALQQTTQQLVARHQHALMLEHRLYHAEERLRHYDVRLHRLEHAQAAATAATATTAATAQPRSPGQTPTNATVAQQPSQEQDHLTPLDWKHVIFAWVQTLQQPSRLVQQGQLSSRLALAWTTLPTQVVAICTIVDTSFQYYRNGHYDLPWLTIFSLMITSRLRPQVPPRLLPGNMIPATTAASSWLTWSMVLWWYRHSDQCLTIWCTTWAVTCLGCHLFQPNHNNHNNKYLALRLQASVWSWLVVATNIPTTLAVTCIVLVMHQVRQRMRTWSARNGWARVGILAILAWQVYVWDFYWDAFLFWSIFYFVAFVMWCGSQRLGRAVRANNHHATKTSVWTISAVILVLFSWSIADCLYAPLDCTVNIALPNLLGKKITNHQ